MKVSLEKLYHYSCDLESCKKWWTIADIRPTIGKFTSCPHCGHANRVEAVVEHEVREMEEVQRVESDDAAITNNLNRLIEALKPQSE